MRGSPILSGPRSGSFTSRLRCNRSQSNKTLKAVSGRFGFPPARTGCDEDTAM